MKRRLLRNHLGYDETMMLYGRDVAPVFRAVAHGLTVRAAAEQVQRRNERILVARERDYPYGVYYGRLYPRSGPGRGIPS